MTDAQRTRAYAATFELIHDGCLVIDADARIIDANETYTTLSGYSHAELCTMRFEDLDARRSRTELSWIIRSIQPRGRTRFETRHRTRLQKVVPVEVTACCTPEVPGQVFVAVRDITEKHERECALRESERRLKEAQRIARLGSWVWEPITNHVWWSEAIYEIFGVPKYSIEPSFEAFLSFVHPDDRPRAIARVEGMLAGADEFADDLRLVWRDGAVRWIHSRCRATRDSAGKIIRAEGTDQDITERKEAEGAIKAKEERHRSLISALAEGVVYHNPDGSIYDCNPSAERILGLTGDQIKGRTSLDPRWRCIDEDGTPFPGENHPAVRTLQTGIPCDNVVMGVHKPDGELTWISINTRPFLRDGDSTSYSVVSSFADITAQKLTEDALRRSEQTLRRFLDVSPTIAYMKDLRRRYLYVNQRVEDIYKIPRLDWIGRTADELLPDDLAEQFRLNDEVVLSTLMPQQVLESAVLETGESVSYLSVQFPLFDEAGQPYAIGGMCCDVTDRKGEFL